MLQTLTQFSEEESYPILKVLYSRWYNTHISTGLTVSFWYVSKVKFRECVIYNSVIKPTRCTNFSDLFLKWNSTFFGQFFCPSSGVFHCTHINGICHTGLLTACERNQNGTPFHPDPARKLSAPDDGQRNCPKNVEFHFKNKFGKLVHLIDFVIRNCLSCYSFLLTAYYAWHGDKVTISVRSFCIFLQYYVCYLHPNKAKGILRTAAIFLCYILENYYTTLTL